jgi:hypothetical protein
MLIIFDSFPRTLDGMPLAGYAYIYGNAVQGLFSNAPHDLQTLDQPHINYQVSGSTLTTIDDRGKQLAYDLRDVLVLYYDSSTGLVEVEPHLPYSWTTDPPYTFSGENPSPPPTALSPAFAQFIGPHIEAAACQTRVPVTTSDLASADGIVEVAISPQNVIIDRRLVKQGTPLNFSFLAPCGVWLRAYFVTPGAGGRGSTVWLISQYGPHEEFGTDTSGTTVSYATAFSQSEPAQPLHGWP